MLEEVKEDIEEEYLQREEVLKKRRAIIPICQEGVTKSLRGELEEAEGKRKEALKILRECERELEGYPVLIDKLLKQSYQEYAELKIVKNYIDKGSITKAEVPSKYYLTGLLDAIGEIKRHGMNKLGEGEINEAEEILRDLEDIYLEASKFSYPNSIVPGLKRKKDVARKVINNLNENIISAKI